MQRSTGEAVAAIRGITRRMQEIYGRTSAVLAQSSSRKL